MTAGWDAPVVCIQKAKVQGRASGLLQQSTSCARALGGAVFAGFVSEDFQDVHWVVSNRDL